MRVRPGVKPCFLFGRPLSGASGQVPFSVSAVCAQDRGAGEAAGFDLTLSRVHAHLNGPVVVGANSKRKQTPAFWFCTGSATARISPPTLVCASRAAILREAKAPNELGSAAPSLTL